MYACVISDILEKFTNSECIIMADVTYGACCIDDLTVKEIGGDLLIHYGIKKNKSPFLIFVN
jgi:2-(3-amino-3-carboxypropyl)histidine synthase